jgi:magnesium transporter
MPSMIYRLQDGQILPVKEMTLAPGGRYIGLSGLDTPSPLFPSSLPATLFKASLANPTARFESREGLDIICLEIWDKRTGLPFSSYRVHLFLQKDHIQVYTDRLEPVEELIQSLAQDDIPDRSFDRFLYALVAGLYDGDHQALNDLENGIASIEDDILVGKVRQDYTRRIVSLRKNLRAIKQYYEKSIDVFQDMERNENAFLDRPTVRSVHILLGRLDRLYSKVVGIMEYVTELREAYQSQVDIRLNGIMKILTVINIIFLPLTLIVGWYGMNLQMPEYHWTLGYPAVILLCIVVVVCCIYYFRKRNWF